jgi:hypothetical protein
VKDSPSPLRIPIHGKPLRGPAARTAHDDNGIQGGLHHQGRHKLMRTVSWSRRVCGGNIRRRKIHRHRDRLGLQVFLESLDAHFPADAGLLVGAEWRVGGKKKAPLTFIDPVRTRRATFIARSGDAEMTDPERP